MNLHLLVWEYDDLNAECDWTHIVTDKDYLSTDDELKIIAKHLQANQFADSYEEAIESITNHWSEKVNMVQGYEIKLERSTANVSN